MLLLSKYYQKSKPILLYAVLMAAMVFALKWLEWKYFIADISSEIFTGLVALLFTFLGAWLALQISSTTKDKPQTAGPGINHAALENLNLTTREYEVLQLLTRGCTNAEIADKLFLSLSTVKTHMSNLFVKMGVKNRTQAMEMALRLRLT